MATEPMVTGSGDGAETELLDRPTIAPTPQRVRRYTSLWRLRTYLTPYRARWIGMVLAAFASLGATIAIPLVTKAVIDGPVSHRDQQGLWALGAVAVAVGIIEAALWLVRRWLVSRAVMGVERDIRKELYARLQQLPMAFHDRWQSGQLLSRIMDDLATVRRFFSFGLILLLMNIVQIVVIVAILLALYWPLGVVVLLAIGPVALTLGRTERQFTKLSRMAQDQTGVLATDIEESALGMRVIKSFGREDYTFDRFDERATQLFDIQLRKVRLQAKIWTMLEVIPNITLIVVLGLGAAAAGSGRITLGTLVAFITMLLSLVFPIASLGFLASMGQEAMTAADRVAEIFDEPVSLTGGPSARTAPSGHLQLRDVGFAFPAAGGQDAWALRHVNLDIQPGETIALVGATGSGKSVLTALIPRLYDVTEGSVLIDGVDIREFTLPALRRTVATAFEDPTLFSLSVRENLTLGRPEATDAEIDRAIDVAQAHFVRDLPFGLETRIGEQGMSLSGGQRQRLSLARAVLADPRVLVLDDTLSALDVHTEELVEQALRRVLHDVTGIVVAHRASTVLLADRVALLQDGRITHVGTHAQLLATVPHYRYLLAADDQVDDSAPEPAWEDDERTWRLRDQHRVEYGSDHACADCERDAADDERAAMREVRR